MYVIKYINDKINALGNVKIYLQVKKLDEIQLRNNKYSIIVLVSYLLKINKKKVKNYFQ